MSSIARHHADWLSLIDVSGPFVSLPVLQRTFPQGLPARDAAQARALRNAWEEWQDNPARPGCHHAYCLHVLQQVLGYRPELLAHGQSLPPQLHAALPEMGETLRPDYALLAPPGHAQAGQPQLLIVCHGPEQSLNKPLPGKHWKATPATRMVELLHASGVALGLVTNGEQWMLVFAPRGEASGYASWFATLWQDEPDTLRAFCAMLGLRRFFGVADDATLLALLQESSQDQQEVTDQLGYQVREAVEVLVQCFDALDLESSRKLLAGVTPQAQYDAALTVMMRLVFLFSAEERGLLHLGKPLYDNNYAVSTLQEQLQEVADQHGEEILERRSDAWTRLLATFRAVHRGVQHQDLLLPEYGGSLFDSDRYPFLEGRAQDSSWRRHVAHPLAVNNRVVLHLLNSLQRLRSKVADETETRRVSFRALGVEQIGHVYEGLLDHTGVRAVDTVLGLKGNRSKAPEIALGELEALHAQGEIKLLAFLVDATGRSAAALKNDLAASSLLDEPRLLRACGQDAQLLARVRTYAGLIRADSFERALVVLPGSVYVTSGNTRRSTGTHYTPPTLTEPIVRHTLEPLVYHGPAEGLAREAWRLKSSHDLLALKVCDMAMGSGAFLVQACRYLAERLIEAWSREEAAHPGQILITPDGEFSKGEPGERLLPQDFEERIAIARRTVADRCLYGVDINPMAVEMVKLSLWLVTMDASRPFTFLDHAFKCGDSLLGVTDLAHLDFFSMRAGEGKQKVFETLNLWRHLKDAQEKREQLESMPTDTPDQLATKTALYGEAEAAVAKLKAVADILVALELKGLKGKPYTSLRDAEAQHMMLCWQKGLPELQAYARERLGARQCFHWALAFPEIMAAGGFHAFVGNPPFVGGQKITGSMGTDYRDYLVATLAKGKKGSADLCAYFFLRAGHLLMPGGMAGLLATNTIAQGDTREVGLDQLLESGLTIPRAMPSAPWPGIAALEVAHVWLHKGAWQGACALTDQDVPGITAQLTPPGKTVGKPFRLKANENKSFQGAIVLGMGFVLPPEDAAELIARDAKNRDCLFPYLNGEDLNTSADQSPSRWVINFFDWPLNRLGTGHWLPAEEKQRKEWMREGIVPSDYPHPVAADYSDLLAIIDEKVRPERAKSNRDIYRERWWQYAEKRPGFYLSIVGLERLLVVSRVSKYFAVAYVSANWVYNERLTIFSGGALPFAFLQNSFHEQWMLAHGATLESRPMYTPSDCFETFPFQEESDSLVEIGENYYNHRQSIMAARAEGLTKTYNRFHNPDESSPDIVDLRRLHKEMDEQVACAYGWQDLQLAHGFHETKQGMRYTISEAARREVLDRLLALNHARHKAEEEEQQRVALAAPSP